MQAFFPVTWDFGDKPTDGCGGPPVADAGALYLWREENNEADWPDFEVDDVAGKTSLREIIEDAIEGCVGGDGLIAEDHLPAFRRLREALKATVAQIDAELDKAAA